MPNTVKNSAVYYVNTQITKVFDQMQSEIFFTENIIPVCENVLSKLSWQYEESLGEINLATLSSWGWVSFWKIMKVLWDLSGGF